MTKGRKPSLFSPCLVFAPTSKRNEEEAKGNNIFVNADYQLTDPWRHQDHLQPRFENDG